MSLQFSPGFSLALRQEAADWVRRSADAVAGYFGRFPVRQASILLMPTEGDGIGEGAAFSGTEPRIRVSVGHQTQRETFLRDWVMVHEMVHLAIPDLPESQTWFHEGIATYVEIVARVQAGLSPPRQPGTSFIAISARACPRQATGAWISPPLGAVSIGVARCFAFSPILKCVSKATTGWACRTRCAVLSRQAAIMVSRGPYYERSKPPIKPLA